MKKKLLALGLVLVLACSLFAPPALAAEPEIDCRIRPDGGVAVSIPAAAFSGSGMVQVVTYSARGRLLDFKSVTVDDLAQGYQGVVSARTEPGGVCKSFLLGGKGYRPLAENAQAETKGPAKLLLTVTGGAGFSTDSSLWNDRADIYLGVDCEIGTNGYPDPRQITYYLNGQSRGTRAVDARPGDIARLYDTNGNGKVDTVMVTQYHVTQLTKDPTVQGDTIFIPGVTGGYISLMKATGGATAPGVTDGYVSMDRIDGPAAELKKGDVILWCFEDGVKPTYTIERPQTVTGKITAISSKGYVRLSGSETSYAPTGISGGSLCSEKHTYLWMDFTNEYTFYLDKNGGVCYYTRNTNIIGGPWAIPIKGGLVCRMDENWTWSPTEGYRINIVDSKNGSLTKLVVNDLNCAEEPLALYTIDDTAYTIIDGVSHETVTIMTKITQSDPDKGITVGTLAAIGDDVVTFNGGKSFQYDEDTFCVVIDLKTDPRTGKRVYNNSNAFDPESLDTDPEVYGEELALYVVEDKSDTSFADYIYVVRTRKS